MAIQEDETRRVCSRCIGDSVLASEVAGRGSRSRCSYCGEKREALTLGGLADRIDEVLQEHLELVSSEPTGLWPGSGYPVTDLIAGKAHVSEIIAGDLRAVLSARHGSAAVNDGEDNPYDSDSEYDERRPNDWCFHEAWEWFRSDLQSRGRFFSPYAEEALSDIFGNLSTHTALDDKQVICDVGPEDAGVAIRRARTARSTKELKAILRAPVRQLGPPPSRLAKGGRMNAPGILVFYGALDEATCVAEARAPVGSHVVGGQVSVAALCKTAQL